MSLKERGGNSAGIIVSDGLTGLENAIAKHFPSTPHQKCTVHLSRLLLNLVAEKDRAELAEDLRNV